MPEPLANRPNIQDERLLDALEAFSLLSHSRPIGFGAASGITTVDILAAASAFGFEPWWFLRLIRELDKVFLNHMMKAQKVK